MKSENLSKQSSFLGVPSETIFQTKVGFGFQGTPHMRKVNSEKQREEQCLSVSQTPQQCAHVECSSSGNSRRGRKRKIKGCFELTKNTYDNVLCVKQEPIKDQIKEEHISSLNDSLRGHSNFLQSTPLSSRHESCGDTEKYQGASSFGSDSHKRSKISPVSQKQLSLRLDSMGDDQSDLPDSSVGTRDHVILKDEQQHSIPDSAGADLVTSANLSTSIATSNGEGRVCQVCGDLAAGFYCGAYICEACKKFFIRAAKLEQPKYVCLRSKQCAITKESRVQCQYCRFQKCLQLNMYPKDGQKGVGTVGVQVIPCSVCSAPSSGFHFGALTCEGCKGFFRRMIKEREACSYKCSRIGNCEVSAQTRNMCKACRYNKCLHIGMSVEGCRIGRQSNAVKHALSLEARKQTALKTEPGKDNERKVDSSPSNVSLDSAILDHCVTGEVEDSSHSFDLSHILSTSNVLKSLSKPELEPSLQSSEISKMEEHISTTSQQNSDAPCQQNSPAFIASQELPPFTDHDHLSGKSRPASESSLPNSEVNKMFKLEHHSSAECQQSSHVFRTDDGLPPPIDHNKFRKNPYFASQDHTDMAFGMSRNFNPCVMRKTHTDAFWYSSENQPQDLSIDLSIPHSSASSSSHTTLQQTLSISTPQFIPSSSTYPPLSSPSTSPINLSTPPLQFSHSFFHRPDFSYQIQRNIHGPYFCDSFNSQEKCHRLGYEFTGSYDSNGITDWNIEPHGNAENSKQLPKQETFVNESRLYSYPHFQVSGNRFLSSFPEYNRSCYTFQEQHEVCLAQSEMVKHSHPPSGQNCMDKTFAYNNGQVSNHQTEASSLERAHIYRNLSKPIDFIERPSHPCGSPQQHNVKLSPTLLLPSQPSSCALRDSPQLHPPKSAKTSTPDVFIEFSSVPASAQGIKTQENSYSSSGAKKITDPGDQNYFIMSNEELNGILLNASRNLAHFCTVNRAKSDVFDADRFKDVNSTWEKMMEHFNFHAKCIVRFAKRVPGFRSLRIDDQVLLLRMATYGLVILNHSRAYEPDTGFYNYFSFTRKEILKIRELFPEFDVIHTHYEHMGIMAQRHALTEMEYAYLSCMLLLNDEYPGLESVQRTKKLKERYMDAFQEYEIKHFPNGSFRFSEMLLRLSEFSQFGMEHNIAVGLVITKNPQLHIPQLYAEMYTQGNHGLDSSDSVTTDELTEPSERSKKPVMESII